MNSINKPALLQAILCDDVRREDNGKQILIGVYGNKILVPTFPITLGLCLWMRMSFPEAGDHMIELLALGDGDIRLLPPATVGIRVLDYKDYADLNIAGVIMQLHAPGLVRFRWRVPSEADWSPVLEIMIEERTVVSSGTSTVSPNPA